MDYSTFGNNRRRRQLNSQATRVRNKIGLLTLRVVLAVGLVGGLAVAAMGLGLWIGILQAAPELDLSDISPGVYSSIIVCGNTGEELRFLHGGENRVIVSLDEISPHMIDAIVAIEDERFWQHNGIDIRGIGRALHSALTTDSGTQGASTITQQLIKNIFGFFEGELVWKLQEQYLAVQMERELTYRLGCRILAKEFILEMYLNEINLGRQNYGVQAASVFYFGIDAADLNIAQSAVIAAITQNPTWLAPDRFPERNWQRAQDVLRNMLRLGFITEEEHFEAMTGDVFATMVRDGSTMAVTSTMCCFHDALVAQLRNDLMELNGWSPALAYREIFTGGLRIYSVQNLEMQEVVDRHFMDPDNFPQQDFRIHVDFRISVRDQISGIVTNFRREYLARSEEEVEAFKERIRQEVAGGEYDEITGETPLITLQPQAAFVLMDHHTGHVLAMRGIRGEKQTSRAFCRATQAERSPGSQMKPLVPFLPAFDLGLMSPASVIDDIPLYIYCNYGINPPHRVNNWYSNPPFEGINTARRAIYHSGNVVSVRAGMETVGLDTMWQYLQRLGFSTLVEGEWSHGRWVTDRNYVLPIGGFTRGVLLIEMAAAYASIANGGLYNRPVFYTRVVDRHGNVILENHHEPVRIMRDTTAYLLIDSMKDTVTRGTGTAMNWLGNAQMRQDIPVAGKTGTSEWVRDLGFTGFTPYLTAAVWMGNDDSRGMSDRTVGGLGPARLFHGPLWRNIMQEIHEWERFTPRQFDRPIGITAAIVCMDSGHLATDICRADPRGSRARSDFFAPGTVPQHYCEVHQEHIVCTETGQLAGWNCANTEARVGIVRPVPIPEEFSHIVIRDRQFEHHESVRTGIPCSSCGGHAQWFQDAWGQWHFGVPDWNNQWNDWSNWGNNDSEPVYDVPQSPFGPQLPQQPPMHEWPPAGAPAVGDDDDTPISTPPPQGMWGDGQ
ncbi:MAG: transglycosylase domain-containing protein [Defluviitaleaceae bacterium]|nr:transglycosylase domain-containing protein [Defluviitaleaceae bacterium]MCL2275514.1 transglycosylase domain-containing protein [Defluviitaleaceae bacterium]